MSLSGGCWLGYSQSPRSVSVATRPAERKHKLMEGEEDVRPWLLVLLLLMGEWSLGIKWGMEDFGYSLRSFVGLHFFQISLVACVLGTRWADSDLPASWLDHSILEHLVLQIFQSNDLWD